MKAPRNMVGGYHAEQEDMLAAFVARALTDAEPHNGFVADLVEYAATKQEIRELNKVLAIPDKTIRGALLLGLVGAVVCRISSERVERLLQV